MFRAYAERKGNKKREEVEEEEEEEGRVSKKEYFQLYIKILKAFFMVFLGGD